MDLDLQWLLIGLPVAFALGWLASRLDLRQLRREREDSPRTYFKGLNLLLSEQQDQAIDTFIEAVQNDPDTTELHFALGKLFRRRGEFERAVRVHEHLLGRSDLKASERDRAQLALAQDYMKAGLFDRAEAAWQALRGTPFDGEAQLALLSLYERSRDWQRAAEVARRLQAAQRPTASPDAPQADIQGPADGPYTSRIAHYECEIAEAADARGDSTAAEAALQRARELAPLAVRPAVLLGQRQMRQGQAQAAMQTWNQLREQHPTAFLLVANDYVSAALAADQTEAARRALQSSLETLPAVELLRALNRLDQHRDAGSNGNSTALLLQHLQRHPSLSAAQLLLDLPSEARTPEAWEALRSAISHSATPLQRYRCAVCGFEARNYFWQCPGCLSWDSYPSQRIDAQ